MIAPTAVNPTIGSLLRSGAAALMPRSVGVSLSNAPPDRIGTLAHHLDLKTPLGELHVGYDNGLYSLHLDAHMPA